MRPSSIEYWSLLMDAAVGGTAAGLALLSLLSLLSERLWVGELSVHFRLQYLVLAGACVLFAAFRHRPLIALLALAVLAVNGALAAGYLSEIFRPVHATAAPSSAGRDVSIVALNLLYRNRAYEKVRDYLLGRDPDVIVLSELTSSWVSELRPLVARYPYSLALPRESPWGLGVYSRYPLEDARFIDLGVPGSVNVSALLQFRGEPLRLYAVHVASPATPTGTTLRNRQLHALFVEARRIDSTPRLLIGDLNLTPFSPQFPLLLERTGLQDARRGRGWQGTWPAGLAPLRVPIDHCLVDPGVRVTGVTSGPFVGSDHLPIEVKLRLLGDSAG